MFSIKEVTNEVAAKFFLSDPRLAYLGCADDVLVKLYHEKNYEPNELSTLQGIFQNDQLIMLFKHERFSQVAMNCHFYLHSMMHGTGMFKDIVAFLIDWMHKNHPDIVKIIVMAPSSCTHVPAVVGKYGFIKEGHLKNAIVWRQQLVDLWIYSLDI